MRSIHYPLARAVLAGSALVSLGTLYPQLAQAQSSSGTLEEIIVTAQRREEGLQSVPISVSVLGTRDLEQQHITDLMSLPSAVPNFSTKPTFSPFEMTSTIRGITQLLPAINSDPAIGTYVDGAYIAITSGSNASLVDIARVEVLKGPQGTLFGRNTIGGAINIVSNEPTDELEGYVKAEAANFDQQTYEGVLNLPIVADKFSTRVAAQYLDRNDGYGRNVFLGNDTGTLDQYYVRGSALFTPTDTVSLLLSGYTSRSKGNSPGGRLTYVQPGDPIGTFLGQSREPFANLSDFQDSTTNLVERFRLEQEGVTGTATVEIVPSVNFKSISAWRQVKYNTVTDTDATPLALVETPAFPVHSEQYSQEFQLYGTALDDRLDWITGVYYFRMKGRQSNQTLFAAAFPPPLLLNQGSTDTVNKSYAAFAQATYALTDRVKLTGGIRYTEDKRHVNYQDHVRFGLNGPFVACVLPNAPAATTLEECESPADAKFDYVPFTVGLDFQATDDVLLYTKISRGYRSGAYGQSAVFGSPDPEANAAAIAANTIAASPEKILSPEVGFKTDLLDHRLRINGAVFYSQYENIQLNQTLEVNGAAVSVITNTGKADIWGGELEATALVGGGLRLNAALGITLPKYDVPSASECAFDPCVSGHGYGVGFGRDFILSPKYSTMVGANYSAPTPVGTVTLVANYSWRSKTGFYAHDPVNSPNVPTSALTTKDYSLVDASASLDLDKLPLTVMLWGRNLNNTKYTPSGFELGAFSYVESWAAPPRTYGMSLKYNF